MRRSHTAVVTRNVAWCGPFSTEPFEAGWASEAIFFLRPLDLDRLPEDTILALHCSVDISPDGIRWCPLSRHDIIFSPAAPMHFLPVRHFGGWLRLSGTVQGPETRFLVYLSLKE